MSTPLTPAAAGGAPQTPASTSSRSPSLTFGTVIHDVVSWWSYAILKKGDLRLFDQLDEILDSLPGPFPASSPLSIRLRCLVPWQELLKQLYTPGCTVGEKEFEPIQDKLLLLHQGFFSKTSRKDEFNDLLRMVQTHSVLSKLYDYFSKNQSEEEAATNKMLDQSSSDWESIYLESNNGVPPSLLDLVDKTNGWDHEDRRDHILQIVSFPESALTYKRLKNKMQSLLLFWFEKEVVNADGESAPVPELLQRRYRGIGYGGEENTPGITPKRTETVRDPPTGKTPAVSKVTNERKEEEEEDGEEKDQKENQSRPRKNRRLLPIQNQKPQSSKNESFISDSSDCDDWSDFDAEEESRRLKMHRERQKKMSMPVGEPSYSEASPSQRKLTNRRKRRRLGDKYKYHPSISIPTTMRKGIKKSHGFDSSDESNGGSNSSSDFDDSDDETAPWTKEQDEALQNGIDWNGYGNWQMILKEHKQLLGLKNESDLQNRANVLLAHR